MNVVGRQYEPIPVTEGVDGALTGRGEVLRLYSDDRFRFHGPASGQDLLSLSEEAQARKEAEGRLQEEQAVRQALEAEMRDLRRRLYHTERKPGDLGHGC